MADELDAAMRQAVARTPVARLATIRPDGRPHLVAIVFAMTEEGAIVTAVDDKPKTTTALQRLANIAATPAVSVLVDHDETDWSKLWWARAEGQAQIHEEGDERAAAVDPLVGKYGQYQAQRPQGPAIVIEVDRGATWEA